MMPSMWQVGILLVIIILVFGTSKLKNVGGDLGSALKGFKKAIKEDDTNAPTNDADFESVEKPALKANEVDGKVPNDISEPQKQATKD